MGKGHKNRPVSEDLYRAEISPFSGAEVGACRYPFSEGDAQGLLRRIAPE